MKSKLSSCALLSLGLGLIACNTSTTTSTAADGGKDAGKTSDASHDSGAHGGSGGNTEMDAGSTQAPHDAGAAPVDATSGDDASQMDASTSHMDASTHTTDSGPADDAALGGDAALKDAGPLTTVTFQEGVANYHGSKSVGISDYAGLGSPGQWNANGATFADGENDWCTGVNIPYAPSYTEIWLLRFDDLNLPNGAQVVSASLTINAFANDTDTTVYLNGRYLKAAWNGDTPVSCAGCSSALVGYRYRDGSSYPWAELGAAGEDSDLVANKTFRLPESGFFPTGHNPVAFAAQLDPSVVQTWLAGQNYGVRIVTGVSGIHVSVIQPVRDPNERAITTRPKLSITYALPH